MTTPKIKKNLLAMVDCPHCKNPIEIYKETKVFKPAEPAEKEDVYTVEKGFQTKLDEHKEAS